MTTTTTIATTTTDIEITTRKNNADKIVRTSDFNFKNFGSQYYCKEFYLCSGTRSLLFLIMPQGFQPVAVAVLWLQSVVPRNAGTAAQDIQAI
jgi:hypothetical protein